MSDLKTSIGEATKTAMKARDKARVGTLRMVNAEIKRIEVDERRELSDADVIGILNKMVKQRQDSLSQFEKGGREDLVAQETFEIELIREFLPEALNDADLDTLIDQCITDLNPSGMQDMGKVMAAVKQAAGGRADMGQASARVKARLA